MVVVMKRLLLSIMFTFLFGIVSYAQPPTLSGKIRFTGEVVAPSCTITLDSQNASKINFSDCHTSKDVDTQNSPKLYTATQHMHPTHQNLLSIYIVYK